MRGQPRTTREIAETLRRREARTRDEQHDVVVQAILKTREGRHAHLDDLKPWARGKLHAEADAVLDALGVPGPPRSYPDPITSPVDPPTVSGTEISSELP